MTIEDLIADINTELLEADDSSLLNPVLLLIRDVYRRIGYGYICEQEEKQQPVTDNFFLKSKDMISIIDIGDEFGNYDYHRIGVGMTKTRSFRETPAKVTFLDPIRKCMVKYYSIPKDEFGIPMIHDAVYSALKEYCISRLLNSRPEHPDFRNRQFRMTEADKLIDQSRSEFVADNQASLRFRRNFNRK